ncbi:hypothetical protein AGLY_014069 [Aphis glycines]|uniref:MULE transposase domain-containing protein n=1 Tax=Aphis glycines TaxID=307491 RepID=A0A6G0T4T8_APHGL|nr:hypothetical protein AGLY_014069 [Aphis glycines]
MSRLSRPDIPLAEYNVLKGGHVVAECRESAQLLIALVHLPLLVFGLPYILWCVSCLRRVVAFWVKPGVLVVVVANSDTNLRMCNNISNASLVHYNYWCAYYPDTCHGHSSIRITLDTRHGHTNLALGLINECSKIDLNFNPEVIHVDFESSIHKAANIVWPLIKIQRCHFHLGQSWWRKIQELGLTSEYINKSSEIGTFLKYIFGLPYRNPDMVGKFYDYELFSIQPLNEQLRKFTDYLVDNYIDSSSHFPPEM